MGLKERRKREKAARRGQILDAARELLFEKGLQATSINQIARRAELGIGTIYFYFRSKEELFIALQMEGLELLDVAIREAAAEDVGHGEKLRKIADAYRRFSREHKNYFDIINYFLTVSEVVFPPGLKQRVDAFSGRIIERTASVMTEGIAAGSFRPVDIRHHAVMFWGILHGILQFRKLETTTFSDKGFSPYYAYAVDRFIADLSGAAENHSVPASTSEP